MFTCSFKNYIRVKAHTAPGHSLVLLMWVFLWCCTIPVMTAKYQHWILDYSCSLLHVSTLSVPRVVKKQDPFLRDYWISVQYLLCYLICKSTTWLFLNWYFFCMHPECRHLSKMKRSWRLVEPMVTGWRAEEQTGKRINHHLISKGHPQNVPLRGSLAFHYSVDRTLWQVSRWK